MIDIESKIISYREDTNDYRLCLTREEIDEIKNALKQDLNNDDEDWGKEYCKLVDLYAIKCQKVRELEDKCKQIRAEAIDECINIVLSLPSKYIDYFDCVSLALLRELAKQLKEQNK